MAVKTITIDLEAYNALASRKRPGESFSQVIKRTLRNERYTAGNLLEHLDSVALSGRTLDEIDAAVRSRPADMVAEPDYPYDA